MVLPDDLAARLQTRRFWTDYLHFTQPDWPAEQDTEWRLSLGLRTSVDLDLTISYGASLTTLSVREAGSQDSPIPVAWDDQAHWHPHVFRWAELESVCQRVAACSEYVHPGVPLLLLYRFAPLTSDAEFVQHSPALWRAWEMLALFSRDEVAEFIDRVDLRAQGVQWRKDETHGWTVHQLDGRAERHLYSLRGANKTDFPFALWNSLMSEL